MHQEAPLKLKVGNLGSLSAVASNRFYTMRPKQALINNNIHKHTSQVGSVDEYRINPPTPTSQSIITRHVSAIGGRANLTMSAQNFGYRSQSSLPPQNPQYRQQSSMPYYNYNNQPAASYQPQIPSYNYMSAQYQQQPTAGYYYQDPNANMVYTPMITYDPYNYQYNQYGPTSGYTFTNQPVYYTNQPQLAAPYDQQTQYMPTSQQQRTSAFRNSASNQPTNRFNSNSLADFHLNSSTSPSPIYNSNKSRRSNAALNDYPDNYRDLVNPHRYIENDPMFDRLGHYSPDPLTNVWELKTINDNLKIDETIDEELQNLLKPFPEEKKPVVMCFLLSQNNLYRLSYNLLQFFLD